MFIDYVGTRAESRDWTGVVFAWLLGFIEAGGDSGMTYDGDIFSPRSRAYDSGRAIAQRLRGIR
jgi:hypothetical protein